MRFRILGPLEVLSPDGWTAISAAKWRSLLACLLLRPGQLVPTELLIDELWGDSPPSTANNLVSIYVHRLKKVIGDTEGRVLVYRAPGYLLRLAPGDLDLQQFESQFVEGRSALAAGDLTGRGRAARRRARRCGAGRCSPTSRRPRCSPRRPTARRSCGSPRPSCASRRTWPAAGPRRWWRSCAAWWRSTRMRERLWALLMRALEDAGRRAEALEVYAQAQEVIADELGVDPGAELQQFYRELLAADASSAAAPPARPQRAAPAAPRGAQGRDNGTLLATCATAADAESAADPRARAADAAPAAAGGAGEEPPASELAGTIAIGTIEEAVAGVGRARGRCRDSGARALGGAPQPSSRPTSATSPAVRRTSSSCARCCSPGNAASSPGAVRIAVVNGAARTRQDHARRARRAPGQRAVPGRPALRGPARGQRPAGRRQARSWPGSCAISASRATRCPARDDERAALYRTTLDRAPGAHPAR